jgi:phosphoenolpyruvate carboxykinase (ATP)
MTAVAEPKSTKNAFDLRDHELRVAELHHNLPPSRLYEHAIRYEKDASIAENGAPVAYSTERQATFSPCFGGPFLVWHPNKYAELLAAKMKQHQTRVWLVNTGWSGGAYGVGKRISLKYTRAIIEGINSWALAHMAARRGPVCGFEVVTDCLDVPGKTLVPRDNWADKAAYDGTARKLAGLFRENFKTYESGVSAEIKAAGPA